MERKFTVKKDFGILIKGDEISVFVDTNLDLVFVVTNRMNKVREWIKPIIEHGQIVKKASFRLVDESAGNIEVMHFKTPKQQPHPTENFMFDDGLIYEEWHEKIINDFIEIGVF
jgi:hypothetical protein